MAKPLRTAEIVEYLLKVNPLTKEPAYSQREISRTIGVSQTTVHKVNSALKAYLEKEGANIWNLEDLDDSQLNALLDLESASNRLSKQDYESILDEMARPGVNGSMLLSMLQSKNSIELSPGGQEFVKDCKYPTFNASINSYCKLNDYSDRFKFKPAEYMEIGVIPDKRNSAKLKTSLSGKRFIFYAYLPYSRTVSMTLIDHDKSFDFTNSIVTALILFMFSIKGLPLKVVGSTRLDELLPGVSQDLLKKYFRFCGLLYSTDKCHSVFEKVETKGLVSKVWDCLDPKTFPIIQGELSYPRSLQDRIDAVCDEHNQIRQHVLDKEYEYLKFKRYSEKTFIHYVEKLKLQNNNHFQYRRHWYSSHYTCRNLCLFLEFDKGDLYIVTRTNMDSRTAEKTRHKLSPNTVKHWQYTSRKDDLPESDEIALRYGLWTEKERLEKVANKFKAFKRSLDGPMVIDQENPVIKVVQNYLDSKQVKQQAFNLIENLCQRTKKNQLELVTQECKLLLEEAETGEKVQWGIRIYEIMNKLREQD